MSEHYVEESVKVYLRFEDGRWVVDDATVDGGALDSALDGPPEIGECTCNDKGACRAEQRRARATPLPTGAELADLLNWAVTVAAQEGGQR